MSRGSVRQLGIQETNIVPVVRHFTKDAVVASESAMEELRRLALLAREPRSGPVWLDVPLDVQSAIH